VPQRSTFASNEWLEIKWLRGAALLTFNQSGSEGGKSRLLVFQQSEAGTHDVACVAITALRDLSLYECSEMFAEAEGCAHALHDQGTKIG
jgi:hypothetical protein